MIIGQRIGPFELKEELGSGAMGTVYKAVYEDGRVVALKVISLGLANNETAIRRFEREAEILKQLKHPNIVRLFGAGRTKGTPYFAMEFVQGEPLDKVLARRLRFSWEEVVQIGKQVCAALQHAHEKGIIHRDLKPSNLMRLDDGTIKLTDFGIAKDMDVTALTAANCTVGTAAYMSPEQCKGETVTSKSDLYSLGVVLFELLTGRKPFTAESPIEMFTKHVNEPPPRPNWSLKGTSMGEIPTWLETIVLQLLEKKPEHRPLNAAMVAQSLDEGMEKFYAGQSAAVDAVKARVGDRRIQTSILDETDREAARTLRGAIQKKKIRKKRPPFYTRSWFILPAAVLFLGAFAGVIYLAAQPPSADSLYRRAQKHIEAGQYLEALYRIDGRPGPVREFLRYHAADPRAEQVKQWQDLAETGDLLAKLKRNAGKPRVRSEYFDWQKVDSNYEALAFEAMRYEDYGDYLSAGERWWQARELAEKHGDMAVAKRLAELRFDDLKKRVQEQKEKKPQVIRDPLSYRIALLTEKLEFAKSLKADHKMNDLKSLAETTRDLYKDDPAEEIRQLADEIYAQFKRKTDDEK
jgi:tRNA A-37 threonylcarbamoyl transferase component Bud32